VLRYTELLVVKNEVWRFIVKKGNTKKTRILIPAVFAAFFILPVFAHADVLVQRELDKSTSPLRDYPAFGRKVF